MPRKRFNAFDDFPVDPKTQPDWQAEQPEQNQPATKPAARTANAPVSESESAHRVAETAGTAGAAASSLFGGSRVVSQADAPQVERIERLKPSQMMPDRFQPRRLLPGTLRPAFFSRKITCYQAAQQWLQMAKGDSGLQAEVDRLLKMGFSFEEHGQIKPITGSWVEASSGDYFFQIETGERRFWAACLQYVAQGMKEEPLLRVEVIANPTRMRQVLENRHAEPPSAVGQACEVASLILAELNVTPPDTNVDEFEFFRQARAQRMPPGLWEKIMPVMDLTRPRLVQLLNILSLPTSLLDLADRYRIPERVLREVLSAPREQWEALLVAGVQNGLTSDDIAIMSAEMNNKPSPAKEKRTSTPPDPVQHAINSLKRFAGTLHTLDEETQAAVLDELANDFVLSDQADVMLQTLRELSERIRIRQQNRYRKR